MKKYLVWVSMLAIATLLPAKPATADGEFERALEQLAVAVIRDMAREIARPDCRQQSYRPAYQPAPQGYYGTQPQQWGQPQYGQLPPLPMAPMGGLVSPNYGPPQWGPPQYQQGLGPVVIMPRQQNTVGYFRQVSPDYYTIDPNPPLPRGARVLQPWVEGQTGVTLHLGP